MSGNASHIANRNPLRYRGYYYDTDTGHNFLQSRYYDPETGRFINADDPGLIESLSQSSPMGANLFVYCENNPVMYKDESGSWTDLGSALLKFAASKTKKLLAFYNYCYNKSRDITSGYINGQGKGKVSKLRFGLFKMGYNGCEIISVYNALKLTKRKASIADIAFEFELNGASMALGAFGSDPNLIGKYLSAHKIRYEKTKDAKKANRYISNGRVLIPSFWTSKKLFSSIHTVAIKCVGRKLVVYNRYNNRQKTYTYSSLAKVFSGGRFIICYWVK